MNQTITNKTRRFAFCKEANENVEQEWTGESWLCLHNNQEVGKKKTKKQKTIKIVRKDIMKIVQDEIEDEKLYDRSLGICSIIKGAKDMSDKKLIEKYREIGICAIGGDVKIKIVENEKDADMSYFQDGD